jgi:hypothetical protein
VSHACTLAEPLTVEIRDGESMVDALLRELRATTATLASLHNAIIGSDTTPSGERLRREVHEAVMYELKQGTEANDVLFEVLMRLRTPSVPRYSGSLADAVRVELARVVDVRRSPIALLPGRA